MGLGEGKKEESERSGEGFVMAGIVRCLRLSLFPSDRPFFPFSSSRERFIDSTIHRDQADSFPLQFPLLRAISGGGEICLPIVLRGQVPGVESLQTLLDTGNTYPVLRSGPFTGLDGNVDQTLSFTMIQ